MAKGKSTGPDGIPMEFYQSFEKIVTPHLMEMFHEAYRVGALPEDTCSGDIALLYKNGDARDPRNYRPITLLQTDYKILAKVLANSQ